MYFFNLFIMFIYLFSYSSVYFLCSNINIKLLVNLFAFSHYLPFNSSKHYLTLHTVIFCHALPYFPSPSSLPTRDTLLLHLTSYPPFVSIILSPHTYSPHTFRISLLSFHFTLRISLHPPLTSSSSSSTNTFTTIYSN